MVKESNQVVNLFNLLVITTSYPKNTKITINYSPIGVTGNVRRRDGISR